MLTIAKLKRWSINYYNDTARAAGRAAKDARKANGGLAEYYSESKTRAPVWVVVGDTVKVAKLVGLSDAERAGAEVDLDVAALWLDDGVAPNGASGRAFGTGSVHGFDLTFCAPKSVSLLRGVCWTELSAEKTEPAGRVLTQCWAAPLVGVADSMPLLVVARFATADMLLPRKLELLTRWLEHSRASARPTLVMGDARQLDLLRLAARFGAPFVPGGDWESPEDCQLAVQAVSSTVERHATQSATGEHYGFEGGTVRADLAPPFSSGPEESIPDLISVGSSTLAQVKSTRRGTRVNIKPLDDKILVHTDGPETITASGLVIPDTPKDQPQKGTVVAVGPGRWDEEGERRIPPDVAEGDVVIYSKYGGTEIRYSSDQYLILSARDVLAVVSKEERSNR